MRLVSIYKSPRKEEMYLYVDKKRGLGEIPVPLLERFGKPVHLMDMPLTASRTLARAKVEDVVAAIDEKGFYLQMPPPVEDYMREMKALADQAQARQQS